MEPSRMERVYSEWRTQRGQRPGGGTLRGGGEELRTGLEPPWELRQLSPLVAPPGRIVERWA